MSNSFFLFIMLLAFKHTHLSSALDVFPCIPLHPLSACTFWAFFDKPPCPTSLNIVLYPSHWQPPLTEIQRRVMAGWAACAKHRDIFKSNLAICLKRQVYNFCMLPAMTYGAETWTLTKQAQNKLAAAQTKMERSMLNITYKDRRTNIWVRERTKLIDILYTVRKIKWSWAGHINRLKDDRWTLHVTAWRPYDKKRRQGRPAKRWRDDLDKYWSDTIWQTTAQDRVIRRRHAEAFVQPRDTTAA